MLKVEHVKVFEEPVPFISVFLKTKVCLSLIKGVVCVHYLCMYPQLSRLILLMSTSQYPNHIGLYETDKLELLEPTEFHSWQ